MNKLQGKKITRFLSQILCILILVNAKLNAQSSIENQIVSSLIKYEIKAPPPDTVFYRKGGVKKIVSWNIPNIYLVKETKSNTFKHTNDSLVEVFLKKIFPDLDSVTYNDYKEKNLSPMILDSIKGFSADVIYVTPDQADSIIEREYREVFRSYNIYKYRPIITLSRPGLSESQDKAFIFLKRHNGPGYERGLVYMLKYEKNEWNVKAAFVEWFGF